jgi:hypothetical protein
VVVNSKGLIVESFTDDVKYRSRDILLPKNLRSMDKHGYSLYLMLF